MRSSAILEHSDKATAGVGAKDVARAGESVEGELVSQVFEGQVEFLHEGLLLDHHRLLQSRPPLHRADGRAGVRERPLLRNLYLGLDGLEEEVAEVVEGNVRPLLVVRLQHFVLELRVDLFVH